jgi:menaquinone-9 beta-reductase
LDKYCPTLEKCGRKINHSGFHGELLRNQATPLTSSGRNAFQVVIVGGGPAGSSAAFTLAAQGISVCLVDQDAFPRPKLCGGLLTLRCKKVFDQVFQQSWAPVIQRVSGGARFFYRDKLLAAVQDYTQLFFTSRTVFDAFLIELARRRGAILWLETKPAFLDSARSLIQLTDGRELSYQFLIGADGVNSFVARSLFGRSFRKRSIGFGLEVEIPMPANEPPVMDPEIYFGTINWGYAWVFPKRQTLTVGVGGRWRNNPELKADFQRFCERRFRGIPLPRVTGHHLPFGDFLSKPGRDNILLCGDAAGLVEPITGEGIAYAMLSGYYAAQAIIRSVARGLPSAVMDFYLQNYERIVRDFKRARRLRQLIFPAWSQPLVARFLPHSSSLPRRHLDLLAGDISYAAYSRFIWGKVLRAPKRLLSRPSGSSR